MTHAIDISRLPGPAQKLLGPGAPAPARLMAARGIIPGLKPGDIVTVVALLAEQCSDPKVSETAASTLAKLPPPLLNGALQSDLEPLVIDRLADSYSGNREVVEKLLRLPRLTGTALACLAERADEAIGELVATNEQRLLECPEVIEKLYLNKRVRMSTADRLIELAVRNGLELGFAAFKEAAAAIKNELIAEATEEPTYDDLLFRQTEQLAQRSDLAEGEDTHEVDEEGEEQVKQQFLPLTVQIAQLTVTQKIRRAMLGTSAERMLLIRDSNRLVSDAAAKSPLLNENEAARISASRMVGEGVLRIIAQNREFTRNYQVKLNLVSNPRTPFSFASRIIPHLRESDLRSLARSKNVPGSVAKAVKQQLSRKQTGKRR
jgi:hypothetical protein